MHSDLLALHILPLDTFIRLKCHVAPVQAWQCLVVVEHILTLDYGIELLSLLTQPLGCHDALDQAGTSWDEGFHEILNCPFASAEGRGREITCAKDPAKPSLWVECDVVMRREAGAIAEAVLALVFVATWKIVIWDGELDAQ